MRICSGFELHAEVGFGPLGQPLGVKVDLDLAPFGGDVLPERHADHLPGLVFRFRANATLHLVDIQPAQPLGVDRHLELLTDVLAGAVRGVALGEILLHGVTRGVADVGEDQPAHVAPLQHALAEAVEALSLVLHDLVELEDLLAHLEVALLDLALGPLDALGEHRVLDRVALLHAQRGQDLHGPLAGKHFHKFVIEGDEEPR